MKYQSDGGADPTLRTIESGAVSTAYQEQRHVRRTAAGVAIRAFLEKFPVRLERVGRSP
jgi:hypothetical protein